MQVCWNYDLASKTFVEHDSRDHGQAIVAMAEQAHHADELTGQRMILW